MVSRTLDPGVDDSGMADEKKFYRSDDNHNRQTSNTTTCHYISQLELAIPNSSPLLGRL